LPCGGDGLPTRGACGIATVFGSPGLGVSVLANTSTTFTATATDAAGNTSACSSGFTYVEDQLAPAAPTGLGSSPASPSSNVSPTIFGSAEAGSTVKLYTTSDCSGTAVASGNATVFAAAGLGVVGLANTATTCQAAAA